MTREQVKTLRRIIVEFVATKRIRRETHFLWECLIKDKLF